VIYVTGGGVDYDPGPYSVTIPAGETSVPFDIFINNDNILEGNENFNLTIISATPPNCVIVGSPHEASVIIVDDDGKTSLSMVVFNGSDQ